MTDKELKRMSRRELLEMLIEQGRDIERLESELAAARKELEDRRITVSRAGTMAEAALLLNSVFEAADKAAAQYLENVRAAGDHGQAPEGQAEE